MAESSIGGILNPLAFHIEKLGLHFKCALCLDFLTNPILFPCHHIFCKFCVPTLTSDKCQCPVCQLQFAHQEITEALHMKSMIAIYKSLNATFSAKATPYQSQSQSHDAGRSLEQPPISDNVEDESRSGQSAKVIRARDDDDAIHERGVKRKKKRGNRSSKTSPSAVMDQHFLNESICSFCHSSKITEGTGKMLYYKNGKEVVGDVASVSKVIPVHSKCIDWAPQVHYDKETIKNLKSELVRAAKLKCSGCCRKGASLGCLEESCPRSYHLPCALEIEDCRWDNDNFLMLCPSHKSVKFPSEQPEPGKRVSSEVCPVSTTLNIEDMIPSMSLACGTSEQTRFSVTSSDPNEWVLCRVGRLSSEEKCMLVEFCKMFGATVSKYWIPNVTHVIPATDEKGACTRTFKFLMAILTGKWILTFDWIRACIEANGPVNEEPYEISLDNYEVVGAPKAGRFRALANTPMIFEGFVFYIIGDQYEPSFKCELFDLTEEGGGTIVETYEDLDSAFAMQDSSSSFLVVYCHDISDSMGRKESNIRRAEAERLAKKIGGPAIPHTWILESIATLKLQPFK